MADIVQEITRLLNEGQFIDGINSKPITIAGVEIRAGDAWCLTKALTFAILPKGTDITLGTLAVTANKEGEIITVWNRCNIRAVKDGQERILRYVKEDLINEPPSFF